MITTVRTTTGRENVVIEALTNKIKKEIIPVKSIFHPSELRGYIFMEGDTNHIEESIKSVPHVRGILNKEVTFEQMERFLIVEKQEIQLNDGDIVEVIGGPLKGEKAKIVRINETKKEITVESIEAAIPIPVTIPINSVTLFEKKKTK